MLMVLGVGLLHSSGEPSRSFEETYTQRIFEYNDRNTDGELVEKEVAPWRWLRISQLDQDQSGGISREEFGKEKVLYLETKGERKLNLHYKETEEESLYLDLYYPEGVQGDVPVLVYTHGGGWAAGDKQGAAMGSMAKVFKATLKEGIAVASVNYRRYRKGKVYATSCVEDSKDAMRYLAKNAKELGVDPHQMLTFGNSAGGHLSLMNALSPRSVYIGDEGLAEAEYTIVGGVSWYGWTNLLEKRLFIKNGKQTHGTAARVIPPGASDAEREKILTEMSPSTYLNAESPPILCVHGDQDQVVILEHSLYLQELAQEVGARVKVITVKGAGHGFHSEETSPPASEVYERLVRFLVDCVK